jgi:hypothetical protein
MRRASFSALVAALVALPAVVAAESPTINAPPVAPPRAASQPPTLTPPPPEPRLLTPEQQGRQGVVHGVIEQPLRDFNITRTKIPPVLLEAMNDAYERPSPNTCAGLTFQIKRLDEALGPDLDQPVSTDHPSLLERGGGMARNAGLDAMRTGVQSQIPFDGVIRFLSGADKHDREVMAAIQAGAVRRGYLKGLGELMRCGSTAIPRHLVRPVTVASTQGR